MRARSFTLPRLRKHVIYLDQHAISHMAKALHPDFAARYGRDDPRTQRGFWRDAFRRLEAVQKLQLAVCPESRLQRQESLLDSRLTSILRTMYEPLAGDTRFREPSQIRLAEVNEAFCAWLEDRDVRSLERTVVVPGRSDGWVDRLRVSARLGLDDIEATEVRRLRDRLDAEIGAIVQRWKEQPRLTFEHYYTRELDAPVEPGDVPNAGEGRAVAEGAVGASLVVVAHPVWQ